MEPDRSRRAQARHALTAHSGSQPEQASAGMRFTDTSIHQQSQAEHASAEMQFTDTSIRQPQDLEAPT